VRQRILVLGLLALAISLLGTQCRAQEESGCSSNEGGGVTCPFSPGNTTHTYSFGGNGSLRVTFAGGVLKAFNLTVTVVTLTDAQLAARLDPDAFPEGTTCFHYGSVPSPQTTSGCQEYAFTGDAGGPNGVPVKNVNYKAPIKLELTYFSSDSPNDPAFGHAPGESTTFSEDILVDYFKPIDDDTMDGSTPSLSSVIALNKPLVETDAFCWISPNDSQQFEVGAEVEVAFKLFQGGSCTGKSVRDNFARLSLAHFVNGQIVFDKVRSDEGGKHFEFDNEEKVNEREIDTEGLTPGTYFITVRSNKFPPQTRQIQLVPEP
jgi:hypothetical protein